MGFRKKNANGELFDAPCSGLNGECEVKAFQQDELASMLMSWIGRMQPLMNLAASDAAQKEGEEKSLEGAMSS